MKHSHLKIFGYVSYVCINYDAHNNLDAKLRKCLYIDHGDKSFGYQQSKLSRVGM